MDIEETFAPLPREELLALAARRDGPGLQRLAVQVPWLVGSAVAMALATTWEGWALAVALNGIAQWTFFGPLHECCHRTAFATDALNRAVGWLAGFVQLTGPARMRAFHFAHHRHTHVLADDPELAGLSIQARWPNLPLHLANASGLPLLIARAGWMVFAAAPALPDAAWRAVMPFVAPAARAGVSRDERLLLLAHLAFAGASWALAPGLLGWYAATWLGHGLLGLYLAPEHRGLPEEGSVLERTRSFAGNPVVDFLMWNMPYHAEHHGWPGVPFHALPALHARVADRLPHQGRRLLALYLSGGADAPRIT